MERSSPRVGPGRRDAVEILGPREPIEVGRDWLWPALIIVGLALVVAVNASFIYIAVSGADEVVESYQTGHR